MQEFHRDNDPVLTVRTIDVDWRIFPAGFLDDHLVKLMEILLFALEQLECEEMSDVTATQFTIIELTLKQCSFSSVSTGFSGFSDISVNWASDSTPIPYGLR